MSTADLRSILHQQIDRLDDPDALQDLALTVSEFVSHRMPSEEKSPELLAQLRRALTATDRVTPHDEAVRQSKQWITK